MDAALAAAEATPLLIAEVNRRMPRTHGHTTVPLARLTAFTRTDRPLHESPAGRTDRRGAVDR